MDYTGTFSGTDDAIQRAEDAREQAYTPFTGPKEGALIVTDDGYGVVGSRVENSNYTNTRHAVETALGDVLATGSAPEYLVLSTDNVSRGSFLKSKPQLLYEFVDGDFPVLVHDVQTGEVQQYSVDEIVQSVGADGLGAGQDIDDLGAFHIDAPHTTIEAENAVERIDTWRDAAYDELGDRLPGIELSSDDPMEDVMREAKDAFWTVDEKPDDVLKELQGYAQNSQEDAYEPYSNYPVGVSLLTQDGRVFFGQNMEDQDISHTMHGEGNAFTTAVTWGMERDDATVLTIHSESDAEPFACGLCRQTAAEFADEGMILSALGKDDSDIEAYSTLGRHLPDMFRI